MAIPGTHLGLRRASSPIGVPHELAALSGAVEWINGPRPVASDLAGSVLLVGFWTYTCINWLRTLPYLRAWAEGYRNVVRVIGVHTPEFRFEHDVDNVRRAVSQMRIEYPVAIDNDYAIWRAFDNHYWPALYLLGPGGRIRRRQFGEGNYDDVDLGIRRLLADAGVGHDRGAVAPLAATGIEAAADWGNLKSPENYLGYHRTEGFASRGGARQDRARRYSTPDRLSLNQWALGGEWTIRDQAAVLTGDAGRIACRFHARDLHLVMGPAQRAAPVRFRVSLDGRPPGAAHGIDVDDQGHGTALEQRLYQLIRQPGAIADRTFEIEFFAGGVETFAFTFG